MRLFSALIISCLIAPLSYAETLWGPKVNVGNGHALSFVKVHKNKPLEFGVALTPEALQNLSDEMKEFSIPLPDKGTLPPFQHITLDWNPQGHEPDGVYNKPHFDVHFYLISEKARKAITCIGEDAIFCMQLPKTEYLVPHYAPTPAAIPQMGWHWVDLLAPEFNGGIFTRTLIHGYYGGEPIFIEPMVSLEYLLAKNSSEEEIRLPEKFPMKEGHYPAGYKIFFDSADGMHKIVVKDFPDEGP